MYSHSSDEGSKLHLLGYTVNSRSKHSYNKRKWKKKKRLGTSFLIVIAFFAVFVIIILIEVLMIDEKSASYGYGSSSSGGFSGGGQRHRFGESMPDYDIGNDEYSIEDAVFTRNRYRDKHRGESNLFRNAKCPRRR